jgi:hypothetical protein
VDPEIHMTDKMYEINERDHEKSYLHGPLPVADHKCKSYAIKHIEEKPGPVFRVINPKQLFEQIEHNDQRA